MLRQRNVNAGSSAEETPSFLSARKVLKKVDVYPKLHREFKVQTNAGATGKFYLFILFMLVKFVGMLFDVGT